MENSIIIASLKRHGNKPVHRKTLANMLSVKKNQRSKFYRQIDRLISQGILTSSGSGRIRLAAANAEGGKPAKKKPASRPKKPAGLVGKMLISRRGYGFVAVEGRDDIFVPARDMAGAAAGDQVLVKLVRSGRKGPAGKILEILKRQRDTVVGTVERTPAGYELSLPWRFANRAVRIDGRTADQELEGALVYARITDWGDGTRPIGAEVLEVIGSPSDPQTDFRNVLLQFELTEQFPDKVEAEVQGLVDRGQHKIWEGRTDLRELGAITIDPASAKDFDDAISLQQLEDGRVCLGVHIADVSHYVRPGSFTDAEAQLRGNSVYFTEAVVPMLPHLLSSDICSLRPDEDRPVLSAMITLTSTGDVEEVRFHRAMIRSRHRFTYEEVQDILQSRSGQWYQLLDDLRRITSGLYAKRVAAGSVDFDIPEPLLELDEYGVPHHIRPSQRLDSHRMVEECMLLANRLVAERVPQAKPRKPFLYRVHAQPPQDQIRKLTSLLGKLRLPELPAGKVTSGHVRDLLQALADSPYRDLIETITIRSMAKALYSADEQPHFGLAFPLYTHFTSPIRRYSDLIVHRLVSAYLLDGKMPRPGLKALASVASSCSEREQTALRAERAYQRLKELRFLATQVGKSFDGVVSGVLPSGIFVQIREFLVDGFVGQQWLNDDIYQYDEGHYALRGKHTGRVLQLGQEVHIQVRDVSVERRFADFILVDGES